MTEKTTNPFLVILGKAIEQDWCIKPYCTTCGARDFRSALQSLGGLLGGPLVNALSEVNFDELMSFPKWDRAIEIAVRDLPVPGQATGLLESWLRRADECIRFFDVVLYRLARYLPEEHPVRAQWITKGIALALQTQDFSLVESLILILERKAMQDEKFITLAKQFAGESEQMKRVLRNACNL